MNRLQTYVHDFMLLRKREQLGIVFILFLAFVSGTVFFSKEQSATPDMSIADRQPATPLIAEMTPIELSPTAQDDTGFFRLSVDKPAVSPLQTFVVAVTLNPTVVLPENINLTLRFHPGRVRPITLEPGKAYGTYPIKELGENGITLSAHDPQVEAMTGRITLATVVMQALEKPDRTFLTLDPNQQDPDGTDVMVQIL